MSKFSSSLSDDKEYLVVYHKDTEDSDGQVEALKYWFDRYSREAL